jgi:hypothetical protein
MNNNKLEAPISNFNKNLFAFVRFGLGGFVCFSLLAPTGFRILALLLLLLLVMLFMFERFMLEVLLMGFGFEEKLGLRLFAVDETFE